MSDNDPISFIRQELQQINENMDAGFTKMNGRVRTIEKAMWVLTGIVLMIGFYLKYLKE